MQTFLEAALPCALASAVAVELFRRLALVYGPLDEPGGRKTHEGATPLIGGVSVFAGMLVIATVSGLIPSLLGYWVAAAIVVAIGVWDDFTDVRPRYRFGAQALATLCMIFVAGVQLKTVGNLWGFGSVGLSVLAIPVTIFAVVGVINAVNMLDGIDGLAGSVAVVALAWYATMADAQDLMRPLTLAVLLGGALLAFLAFNLRFPWQPRARVFLGDAGSMLIGFTLAWLAIDLTQGPGRTIPPICALWVVLLPLADCVSLMMRRLQAGKSPFAADRQHIHHYLLARGIKASATLAILVGISALFGAVGYFGWRQGAPEPVLFWAFFFLFFGYHFVIAQAWKRLGGGLPA